MTALKAPLIEPPEKPSAEENRPVMDTSKMSAGQRAALELTEAARETLRGSTFASGLFVGEFNLRGNLPFPAQSVEDRKIGDAFLTKLETLLREKVDPDEIDRTEEIPQPVIDELAKLGAFGIKVPIEYGGLGLSQTNYCRAATLIGSWCGNLTASDFGASVNRRAATSHLVRHRGAKEKISAAGRAGRDFCLRPDGNRRRL